jgi:hypothetical protein
MKRIGAEITNCRNQFARFGTQEMQETVIMSRKKRDPAVEACDMKFHTKTIHTGGVKVFLWWSQYKERRLRI